MFWKFFSGFYYICMISVACRYWKETATEQVSCKSKTFLRGCIASNIERNWLSRAIMLLRCMLLSQLLPLDIDNFPGKTCFFTCFCKLGEVEGYLRKRSFQSVWKDQQNKNGSHSSSRGTTEWKQDQAGWLQGWGAMHLGARKNGAARQKGRGWLRARLEARMCLRGHTGQGGLLPSSLFYLASKIGSVTGFCTYWV